MMPSPELLTLMDSAIQLVELGIIIGLSVLQSTYRIVAQCLLGSSLHLDMQHHAK